MKAGPLECIETKPNKRTTKLGGKYINQAAIARSQGIDQSYISRIISGEREPRRAQAKLIAAALGMTVEEFFEALEDNKAQLAEKRAAILKQHEDRINAENHEDADRIRKGMAPIPRVPGLRAS